MTKWHEQVSKYVEKNMQVELLCYWNSIIHIALPLFCYPAQLEHSSAWILFKICHFLKECENLLLRENNAKILPLPPYKKMQNTCQMALLCISYTGFCILTHLSQFIESISKNEFQKEYQKHIKVIECDNLVPNIKKNHKSQPHPYTKNNKKVKR